MIPIDLRASEETPFDRDLPHPATQHASPCVLMCKTLKFCLRNKRKTSEYRNVVAQHHSALREKNLNLINKLISILENQFDVIINVDE